MTNFSKFYTTNDVFTARKKNHMTQEELLVLVYKKDERAFTHLYDMYSKSLFSVINVLFFCLALKKELPFDCAQGDNINVC